MAPHPMAGEVEVLAFDIFGTVVDWHGSIVRELAQLQPQVDGDAFARAWRAGYKPAMARVMSGDALVGEHERLQARVNHLHDKLEGALRQCLRDGADDSPDAAHASLDIRVRASALTAFVIGRVQRQVKTGFARPPGEWAEDVLARMLPPR